MTHEPVTLDRDHSHSVSVARQMAEVIDDLDNSEIRWSGVSSRWPVPEQHHDLDNHAHMGYYPKWLRELDERLDG